MEQKLILDALQPLRPDLMLAQSSGQVLARFGLSWFRFGWNPVNHCLRLCA